MAFEMTPVAGEALYAVVHGGDVVYRVLGYNDEGRPVWVPVTECVLVDGLREARPILTPAGGQVTTADWTDLVIYLPDYPSAVVTTDPWIRVPDSAPSTT